MSCPVCQHDRDACHACAGVCTTCEGRGELADNPGWPDPQCAVTYECPICGGEGMFNPEYTKTYTETWLEHTRGETAADNFDAEFDELLARQDRMTDHTPQTGALAPLFPPRERSAGAPSRPSASEDTERKAA
jgi:hypothetical protein